jgi:replication factor C subunit 2/4
MQGVTQLWDTGYSALDIITTMFKVAKGLDNSFASEAVRLDLIQIIGGVHLRVADGCGTLLQMQGLVAKMASLFIPRVL